MILELMLEMLMLQQFHVGLGMLLVIRYANSCIFS